MLNDQFVAIFFDCLKKTQHTLNMLKVTAIFIFSLICFSAHADDIKNREIPCENYNCYENLANLPVDGSDISDIPVPDPFDFPLPNYKVRGDYSHIDPEKTIKPHVLNKALAFYDLNFHRFKIKEFINVIDFSLHASEKRMYLINMQTGRVKAMHASVGRGTDPDGDGIANTFSNISGSNMTSLGFYLTDDEYIGGNGRSMRLHGLSSTNSNALTRYIVVHGADYVSEEKNYAGRSLGCPAVDYIHNDDLIDKTKNGSLLFIWHPLLDKASK